MGKIRIMAAVVLIIALLPINTAEAINKNDIENYIAEQALTYNLSPELVEAVIMKESSYREKVKNIDGTCVGLMQVNESDTAPWIAEELGMESYDLTNPYDNIRMGCFYMAYLRDYWTEQGFPDEEVFSLMLLSYNRGIGGCKKYISSHENWMENEYVRKVLEYKIQYETE